MKMSDEIEIPRDAVEVREELEKVLDSDLFLTKPMQSKILRYLVTCTVAGDWPNEKKVAREVYEENGFKPEYVSKIRTTASEIRKTLSSYYMTLGMMDSVGINLPKGTYVPVFTRRHPILLKAELLSETQTPGSTVPSPLSHTELARRPTLRDVVRIASWVAGGGIVVACILWPVYNRKCVPSNAIAEPMDRSTVRHRATVQVTRASEQSFCRCKDYLVVEARDLGAWFVQGRLLDGPEPSITATFGDSNTSPGTVFSVFVLTTKADLPVGPVSQVSAEMTGAVQSKAIQVTLEKP